MVNQPECHSDSESDVTHYDNEFVTVVVSAVPLLRSTSLSIRRRRIGLGQCHGCLLYYVYYRLLHLKREAWTSDGTPTTGLRVHLAAFKS